MSIIRKVSLVAVLVAALFSSSAVMAESPSFAGSDSVFLIGGIEQMQRHDQAGPPNTYTYQAEFLHQIAPHYSLSLDYTNQGHFDRGISHHRDLDGINFWVHTPVDQSRRFNLAFGLGPVFYYDTVGQVDGHPADQHGLGMNYSLAATWRQESWLYQARFSHVEAGSFRTNALLLGLGYQFGNGSPSGFDRSGAEKDYTASKNEVTIYSGLTVVNQPGNSSSRAFALEYRRNIGNDLPQLPYLQFLQYLQYTVTAQSEGRSAAIDRQGLAGQIWLAKSFLSERLELGVGLGVLAAKDQLRPDKHNFITPMRSIAAAYRLNRDWSVRVKFDRVISNYDRDTDIFLFGVSRRF